ncbi:MAG: glycosyltransferase family 4 protein [Myxococcota bacterium]|nr:glycosyltransferase family 4 protein [Myxococcota bacterium]
MKHREKPRVLFVNSLFRTYERQLYEALATEFELHAVFISPPPASDAPVLESLRGTLDWKIVGTTVDKLTPAHVRDNAGLFRLTYQVGRRCDAIISGTTDSWKARVVYAAARAARVPVGLRKEKWHDRAEVLRGLRGVYWRGQERWTAHLERHATGVLVGGTRAQQYLLSQGVPPDHILPFRYLHADLGALPLDPVQVAELERHKAGRTAFLYLGRVMRQKGLADLVRAFQQLVASGRDAVLFVVGGPITSDTGRGDVSTAYYDECQRLAAGDPRIVFFGATAPDRVQNFYAAADVFIHPHVATVDGIPMYEGWGNVITEAMSMSKPVITTTHVASAFDVVTDDRTGYLLDASAVEAGLVDAMARFVDAPTLARELGANARRTYETFVDPSVNIATIHRLIHRGAPT